MLSNGNRIRLVTLIASAVVGLSACAGDASGGAAIVQVGTSTITKATLDRWLGVYLFESAGNTSAQHGPERTRRQMTQELLLSLISYEWVAGEATDLRLVSNREVQRFAEREKKSRFPKEGEFQQHLRKLGEVPADFMLAARLTLSSEKLFAYIAKHAGPSELQQKDAIAIFVKHWRAKWRAKTTCKPGYVVQKCREFPAAKAAPEDPFTLN